MMLKLTSIVVLVLIASVARAEQLRLLIVDPADSETGRTCEEILLPGNTVRRSDLAHIAGAANERWNAVIWLRPEPTLFPDTSRALWEKIVGEKQTGLMLIGQPHDQPGRDAMF